MMNLDILIPILVGLSVMAIAGAVMIARIARRAPLRARLVGPEGKGDVTQSVTADGPGFTEMIGAVGTAVSSGKSSPTLREELTQAGYHNRSAAAIYMGAKALLVTCGLTAMLALVLPAHLALNVKFILTLSVAGVLFFIPNIAVQIRRARRRGEIRRHLPDAIDLLEICASAGMGMDMAWNAVGDEARAVSSVLADEMALTNLEIHLGAGRAVAMRNMARRTGAEELSSLVAVLVQSERFGTSIVDALRTFATSMRENRSMRAQEAAEKLAVKLIFPMVLFIFPAVGLVMIGPAGMTLWNVLAK